ncbi:MAG: TolC family protein [Planctomycetota bacterium]
MIRPTSSTAAALALAAASSVASGCYSPAELRDRADRDAFALIDSRRKLLFDEEGPFALPVATASFGRTVPTMDETTTRERVLAGVQPAVGPIDVVDALLIASENSETFQREQESLYLSSLTLTEEQWRFGNRYNADAFAQANGDIGGTVGTASTGFSGSMTRILGSGAVILADVGASLFRFISTGDGWDAISNLGLSVTQPLLRGSGRLVTLEPLRQTERNLVYAVRDYERFRRTFAVDVAERVYRVQQSLDQLNNETLNFNNLASLRTRNERLAEAGQQSEIQADQARQDALRSRNRLVVLQGNTERQLDAFKVFLGLPIQVDLTFEPGILVNLEVDDSLLVGLRDEVAVDFAIDHRLDVMTAFDRVQDATRREAIARDGLRAGLDVFASANQVTREGRVIDYRIDDTFWSAGVDLDLPVDLLPARNAWRRAEIALVDTRRRYNRFLDDLTFSVRDAARRARNSSESFKIQEGAVKLAERRVRGAELSLEAGSASTRDLLESQEALRQNRDSLTSARIEFTLSLLDLWLELEILRVDDEGIYVDADLADALRARLALAEGDTTPTSAPADDGRPGATPPDPVTAPDAPEDQ